MKLFLHWLCWDLRRFRILLLGWTILVVGYTVLIRWLNPENVRWDPDLARTVWFLTTGVVIFEVFGMLHVLTADPVVGTDVFWKTRPAPGLPVAAAKIGIALTAFVLLPLGLHALAAPVGRLGASPGWQVLEGFQLRLLGLVALGAAAVKTTAGATVRILTGLGLALVLSLVGPPLLGLASMKSVAGGSLTEYSIVSCLWLVAGTGLFLSARRSHHAAAWVRWSVWIAPSLLILLGTLIGPLAQRYEASRAIHVPPAIPSGARIVPTPTALPS